MPENKVPFVSETYQGPRRSLVLAGGGVRLAYQAGVLQALQQAGLQFNHVDGTSGGIFNTGMLASGLTPDEMADRWRALKIRYFMSALPVKSYLKPFRLSGMGDADGIRKGVFPSLDIDVAKIRDNKSFRTTFNVCNFSEKMIESIPGKSVSEDLLVAGVSLPIFMPSLYIQNAWYTDAVWIKDANLMEAARQGAEEIWLVWAIGNSREYLNGSFNQYVHMIEMSANGGLLEEFQQLIALNERIKKGDSPYGQKAPVRLHVIKPRFPLPLDPDLFFNKIDTPALINFGYADAFDYMKYSLNAETGQLIFGDGVTGEKPPAGNPGAGYSSGSGSSGNIYPGYKFSGILLDAQASKMNEPGTCLHFRMVFEGKISFNNVRSHVFYRLAFKLRQFKGLYSLYTVSSIGIEKREISTFNTVCTSDGKTLQVETDFRNEKLYHLHCSIPLHSHLDWRLGLEFKKAKIQITEVQNGKPKTIGEGIIFQSISNRFRYLMHCNLLDSNGSKQKKKDSMMKWFYKEELIKGSPGIIA